MRPPVVNLQPTTQQLPPRAPRAEASGAAVGLPPLATGAINNAKREQNAGLVAGIEDDLEDVFDPSRRSNVPSNNNQA